MSPFRPVEEQLALLMRGVEFGDATTRVNMEQELRARLAESRRDDRPLRVYCGFDPTASDLHLGHTVPLRKLAQFQELGHEVIFLIGTYTSLIGDPSDKTNARRQQTEEQAREYAKTFTDQAWKVLDPERTLIMYNGEWLSKLMFKDIIGLASNFTVQQFLVRENFALRLEKGDPIWLHEFMYALMQGYDAVAMRTDIQIGGTDQLFNLIAGRKLMEAFGLRPQTVLTFPILVGTDGVLRMSKSTGNHIGINEPPEVMFGKVMSIPDSAMRNFFDLVTRFSNEEIAHKFAQLEAGELHPRDLKMQLAFEIVDIFQGRAAAEAAQEHFRAVFQQRELPSDMEELRLVQPVSLVELLTNSGHAPSKSEVRRLVQGGGVRLDGERVNDANLVIAPDREHILQMGRRKFIKLVP
ncbi:MAG: Tyrosine--tRNA ligase [Chloroflexi bacterium ADurb.Bin325]|nr:MAG: Tyrosine--tRNA ligase [Chloroflexi bacterium ADurb.Bin325]